MAFQTIFKRYELKYLITDEQKGRIIQKIKPYTQQDKYGLSTIRNIYFDTDNYRLIRRSIEKPTYKEKLRIRCYGKAEPDSTVFTELKKKYRHVVYKRRISLTEAQAMDWLCNSHSLCHRTQISDEIDYFMEYYETLHPVVFLSYNREAFYSVDTPDFRITFDDNILCRTEDLSLTSDVYGAPILPEETVMMEIKCSGGIPMWMTEILSEEHIYTTSFSKYGTAYKQIIFPNLSNEVTIHA